MGRITGVPEGREKEWKRRNILKDNCRIGSKIDEQYQTTDPKRSVNPFYPFVAGEV